MVFLSFYLCFFACFVLFDDVRLLKRQCQVPGVFCNRVSPYICFCVWLVFWPRCICCEVEVRWMIRFGLNLSVPHASWVICVPRAELWWGDDCPSITGARFLFAISRRSVEQDCSTTWVCCLPAAFHLMFLGYPLIILNQCIWITINWWFPNSIFTVLLIKAG